MRKKEEGHHHHLIQQTVLPVMTAEVEAEENSRNLRRKGKEQEALHLLLPAPEADQDLSSPRTEERKLKKKKTQEERKKPYQLSLTSLTNSCQNC